MVTLPLAAPGRADSESPRPGPWPAGQDTVTVAVTAGGPVLYSLMMTIMMTDSDGADRRGPD